MYLNEGAMGRLHSALREAALSEPLTYLGTAHAADGEGFALEAERWPGGGRERLAVFDFHGDWLAWRTSGSP
jgi:hypothetical protein